MKLRPALPPLASPFQIDDLLARMAWAGQPASEDGGAWARREAAVEAFFVYEISAAEVSPAAPPPAPRGGGASPPPAALAESDAGSA